MRRLLVSVLAAALLLSACGPRSGGAEDSDLIRPGSPKIYEQTLRSLRGKPVVVNFWGSWCIPCRKEMPLLVKAARRYEEVRFLGVDVQDDEASAESFARRYKIPFESLADPKKDIVRAQGLLGLPVTLFYRSDGELAFVHNGPIGQADLTENIEQVILVSRSAERER